MWFNISDTLGKRIMQNTVGDSSFNLPLTRAKYGNEPPEGRVYCKRSDSIKEVFRPLFTDYLEKQVSKASVKCFHLQLKMSFKHLSLN